MDNSAMVHQVNDAGELGKHETSAHRSSGDYLNIEDVKPDFTAEATLKVTSDDFSNFFCHEVFGQLKAQGHQCNVCGRVFPYRYQLIVHMRYHTFHDGKQANISFEEKEDSSINMVKDENKSQFPCPYCGRCFSRKEHLANHVAKHTGENPHECHLCSKSFSRKDHLDNHIKAHESDFKCHICLKIFTRKEHLMNHVQWHTGTSPHRCGLCHKIFTRKEHLVNHVRQHTGESPHVCRFCGKAFTRKEHVVNHERGHTGAGEILGTDTTVSMNQLNKPGQNRRKRTEEIFVDG